MTKRKLLTSLAAAAVVALGLTACNDADVASRNISTDADNFKIARQVVFINGITDEYLLSIEGFCSYQNESAEGKPQIAVTCKVDDGYKKHTMGLSDNVTYVVEQLESSDVSSDYYKITYKPTAILPNLENTSGD